MALSLLQIWPTSLVDYTKQWTMYHYQFQERNDGSFRLCGSINALPLDCTTEMGTLLQDPRQLIQVKSSACSQLLQRLASG